MMLMLSNAGKSDKHRWRDWEVHEGLTTRKSLARLTSADVVIFVECRQRDRKSGEYCTGRDVNHSFVSIGHIYQIWIWWISTIINNYYNKYNSFCRMPLSHLLLFNISIQSIINVKKIYMNWKFNKKFMFYIN